DEERGVGRQAPNFRFERGDRLKARQPAQQVRERAPTPFLEEDEEGEKEAQKRKEPRARQAPKRAKAGGRGFRCGGADARELAAQARELLARLGAQDLVQEAAQAVKC